MHVIILIKKYSNSCFFWPNLIRKKRIAALSVEQIIDKYQGFEGDLVFLISNNENEFVLNEVFNEHLKIKNADNFLLLHLFSGNQTTPILLKEHAIPLGYDVGICEEAKTIYSSIFNEVLFGNINELIFYAGLLNDNFLFPNKSIAEKYISLHSRLSAEKKDVEDYEKMVIYEVWKHNGKV
jgi:hypothetical protein